MITVLEQPNAIALSGNPMVLKLRCTDGSGDPLAWRGVYSEWKTTGYFRLAAGESFQIEWTEPSGLSIVLEFVATNDPDSTINGVPDNTISYPSDQAYWAAVADKIQAHPQVSPRLVVYSADNGSGITMTAEAITYESDWVVNWDPLTVANITVENTTLPSSNMPDQYRVYVDIIFESIRGSGVYYKAGMLEDTPGADSEVIFDVSSVVDAALQSSLPELRIPEWDDNTPLPLDSLRNYYLRVYEITATATVGFGDVTLLDAAEVLGGGVAQNVFASIDFLGSISQENSLLTWKPSTITIDQEQPEWIPWYNYTAEKKRIALRVATTDENNVTTDRVFFDTAVYSYDAYQVAIIPVGYRQLNLQTYAPIVKYSITVIDWEAWDSSSGFLALSPTRTYYIDTRYYQEVRYLQYTNSFHAPETLRCTGILRKELEVESQDTERSLIPGFSSTIAQRYSARSEWKNRFTYYTGFITAQLIDTLQELLIYRRVYEVSDLGYIPLFLQGKKFPIHETKQNLHSIQIAAYPALLAVHYSNVLTPTPESYWEEDSGDYWLTNAGVPWQEP